MKTLFLSDIHIGCKYSQSGKALELIRAVDFDRLILVGDIVDLWQIKRGAHLKKDDFLLMAKLVKIAAKKPVIYCYGNHDADLKDFNELEADQFTVCREYVYTSNNKQILVTHGDLYDSTYTWVEKIGDIGYYYVVYFDYFIERVSAFLRFSPWSLSSFLRKNAKAAAVFLSKFENKICEAADERGCSAVVCGHIHVPQVKQVNGVTYANCGDFLQSCTGLFECNGEFQLLSP